MKLLGAINKNTGEYIYPKIANKNDKYICLDCNQDVIICRGNIRVPYFRHYNTSNCDRYNKPTETQIHKDAKFLIKSLLNKKIKLSFIRKCICCKKDKIYEIPEITDIQK